MGMLLSVGYWFVTDEGFPGTSRCLALSPFNKLQLSGDLDRIANAPSHRATACVETVGPFGRFPFVTGAPGQPVSDPDPLDHQNLILDLHIAFSLGAQLPLASIYPARFQRATQRPGQSTSRGSDHVIERRGMVRKESRGRPVVLAHLVVRSE